MRFKNIEQYRTGGTDSHMQLAIPLPKTPDGRVYRYSPNEQAHPRHFVLGGAIGDFSITDDARKRMKLEPRSSKCVCPYSGQIDEEQNFTHPDDVKAATEVVGHAAFSDVEDAIHEMFSGLSRKFAGSKFLKIETRGRSTPRPKPRFSRRDLLRELVCDHCGRDYGVYAIGLFCPDCGAPNLRLHFAREVELVSGQVDLAEAQQNQELAYRLMGNAHEDVLTAFEATLKAVYLHAISSPAKPVKNDFQNVENAQRRFAESGLDPFTTLPSDALAALKLNIQKRHIIGHNLGVMDEKFANHAADARLGETVHLVGADIRQFAAIAQQVVDTLDTWLGGGIPSPRSTVPLPAAPQSSPMRSALSDLGLSDMAVNVAKWTVHQATDGMSDPIEPSLLPAAFPDCEMRQLDEAIAELKLAGYLSVRRTMRHELPDMRPNPDLFATFDPLAGIGDPVADSALLIGKILENGDSVNVPLLYYSTGWPLRRFNPAIAVILSQIDSSRVSGEVHSEHPTRHFRLTAEDRVNLRRCATRLAQ